jgi:hypothetical protein
VPQRPTVEQLIDRAALRWGLSARTMRAIAWCESRFDPNATNPRSGAAGVFQWLPSSWAWASPRAGWAGYSPYHAEANINVAAWAMRRGYWSWWNACR